MNLYSEFGTNKSKEEGIKVEPMPGIFFTIKRTGGSNKAYSEAATKRLRPYVQKFNSGKSIPLDIIQQINIELFSEYIMLDWQNVTDRSGNQLPFTKENAKKLLLDLPELYNHLSDEAGNLDNFKDAEEVPGKVIAALNWLDRFSGKQEFYDYLDETGKLSEKDRMPDMDEIVFYLESFIDLSTERSIGMALGPIPISKIISYQLHFGLSEEFVNIIRQVDSLFLKEVDNKTKKAK